MRKIILFIAFISSLGLGAVSAQNLPWSDYSLAFSNQTSNLDEGTLSVSGIGLEGSSFWGEDIGFLTTYSILALTSADFDGTKVKLDNYNLTLGFNFFLGPGYRLVLDEKLVALFGLGVHAGEVVLSSRDYTVTSFGLLSVGVGGEAAIQYLFNEHFGVSAGASLGYDFAAPIISGADGYSSGFSVVPHVGIVFHP